MFLFIIGKDPLVNWIYATPHYRQPGAAMTEYSVLKDAARDESLDAREIVALVVTNGESTGFPQAPPAEPTRDVADPNADTEDKTPHQTHVRSENDAKPQGAAAAHTKEVTCGNCHRPGHELRDCIGPVDAQGWLAGCPLCNSASHLYHECIRRKTLIPVLRAKNDQDFLLYYRQNKPPIKCTIDWTEVYNKRHPLLIALPWTPAFALQQSKVTGLQGQEGKGISWEAYEYEWVDNPDLEARHRMKDPAVDDLAKKTLAMFGVRWEPTDEF